MLEIARSKNYHNYDVFSIITDDGVFEISFENNLDLYWRYKPTKSIEEEKDIKSFKITKENYYLYCLFNELYEAIKNKKPYFNYPYGINYRDREFHEYGNKPLYDNGEIRWYSDDFADLDNASNFAIRKNDDYFTVIFTKSKTEPFNGNYFKTYSVRLRNSGSRFAPFDATFMSMYEKLKDYNPEYHQIHIEEYLYKENHKKRVLSK